MMLVTLGSTSRRCRLDRFPGGFFSFTDARSRDERLLFGLESKTHAVRPIIANFQNFRDGSIKLDAVAR